MFSSAGTKYGRVQGLRGHTSAPSAATGPACAARPDAIIMQTMEPVDSAQGHNVPRRAAHRRGAELRRAARLRHRRAAGAFHLDHPASYRRGTHSSASSSFPSSPTPAPRSSQVPGRGRPAVAASQAARGHGIRTQPRAAGTSSPHSQTTRLISHTDHLRRRVGVRGHAEHAPRGLGAAVSPRCRCTSTRTRRIARASSRRDGERHVGRIRRRRPPAVGPARHEAGRAPCRSAHMAASTASSSRRERRTALPSAPAGDQRPAPLVPREKLQKPRGR